MQRNAVHRDAVLAALCAVALVACATKDVDALGVTVAVLAAAPLAWRTRAPALVVVLSGAGLFPLLATLKPSATIAVVPMIALYTLAVQGTRRDAVLGGLLFVAVEVAAMAAFSPHPLLGMESLQNLALIPIPLCLGRAVCEKRAHMAALREQHEQETERRVGEERLRIAREVHDVVAHAIVAINVQSGVAAHLLDRRPEAARDALVEIKRVSGEALTDLRATLGVLREDDAPAPTRPAQGFAALDELAGRVRAAGVDVDVDVRSRPGVPSAVEAAGFRIVQEALTNVLRHAGAGSAAVRVEVGAEDVRIEVVDDGVGARATVPADGGAGTGNGLRGMRERAAAVGGVVETGGRAEGGWRVAARLPLPAA